MDDRFELPSAATHAPVSGDPRPDEHDELEDDDEDGGPDWTNLPAGASSTGRLVIPKRGEKDHEPATGGETRLQSHVLDRARTAMFSALRGERAIASKSLSHAIWYPALARAHVPAARGVHFASLGHSVARAAPLTQSSNADVADAQSRSKPGEHKRLELLPEETLYLVERGSLACALAYDDMDPELEAARPAMSVQQAFAAMIGTEGLTLERYQVYSYLKRLGYVVTRAVPPSTAYPMPQVRGEKALVSAPAGANTTGLSQPGNPIQALLHGVLSVLRRIGLFQHDWWHPLMLRGVYAPQDSASIYRSLRDIAPPRGHSTPLITLAPVETPSPYAVFFHLYKPATPFRKTAPPAPDFEVVVINAQTTPMPTLHEFDVLFGSLPELPLPQPRKRDPPLPANPVKRLDGLDEKATPSNPLSAPTTRPSFPWVPAFLRKFFGAVPSASLAAPARTNPFMALKQGRKIIVVAVVDAGSVGFFRFGQGCFEEWPMA